MPAETTFPLHHHCKYRDEKEGCPSEATTRSYAATTILTRLSQRTLQFGMLGTVTTTTRPCHGRESLLLASRLRCEIRRSPIATASVAATSSPKPALHPAATAELCCTNRDVNPKNAPKTTATDMTYQIGCLIRLSPVNHSGSYLPAILPSEAMRKSPTDRLCGPRRGQFTAT